MKTAEIIVGLATLLSVVLAYVFRRRQPTVAAKIVFTVIWINAAGFFLKIFLFALTKEGGERAVLVVASVVAPALVAGYWHRYWQRKRPDKKQIESGSEGRA
jgi:lipopolysaccharide export LptBFGC system permease protein LptF